MPSGLKAFLVCLAIVVAMDLASMFVVLPVRLLPWASLALTFFSLSVPIYAIFRGAEQEWSLKLGWSFVGIGAVFQGTMIAAMQVGFHGKGLGAGLCLIAGQAGLLTWCLGAGGLVSRLIKDKNILLPVTLFLAALDMFLVLTPTGITHIVMNAAPQALHQMGYAVPRVATPHTHGLVRQLAVVGPADLLFLAMFFASLHKFGMRARQTAWAMVPTLFAYLLIVVLLGGLAVGRFSLGALPALVPIGAVVLIANFRMFTLSKEEAASTVLVGLLMVGLLAWGLTR
jgi:hypothetical protein